MCLSNAHSVKDCLAHSDTNVKIKNAPEVYLFTQNKEDAYCTVSHDNTVEKNVRGTLLPLRWAWECYLQCAKVTCSSTVGLHGAMRVLPMPTEIICENC